MCNCFLKNFAENKRFYFYDMASLSTMQYISIDHTFKVAANVGYLRPDGRWITEYDSLFIVLNNIGQVIAWQFTQTTSTDECKDHLSALKERLLLQGAQITELYVDNCCTVRAKLQGILGPHVRICLDLFHATQRITKAITERHAMCKYVMKDVKLLFRDPRDKGRQRTLPTPSIDTLAQNLEFFISKWKDAEVNGCHILNDKVLKTLDSLKVHIKQGCLSDINPGCGTNRNENLHHSINPFFSRCRMGIRLAMALLTVLFHRHNQKLSPASTAISILSARALYPRVSNSSTEEHTCFGIMKKTETPHIDDWIFGSPMPQRMPQLPSTGIAEFVMNPELDDIVTFQNISTLLHSSWSLQRLFRYKHNPQLCLTKG